MAADPPTEAPGPADSLARRVADGMYANDRTARHLGIRIDQVAEGRAVLSMDVVEWMLNGHDIGHGGVTFTLADTAFAYACNSRNRVTVAQDCQIAFLAPVRKGDTLTATAEERVVRGRGGVYDVRVTNQAGDVLAEFRGRSRALDGTIVDTPT